MSKQEKNDEELLIFIPNINSLILFTIFQNILIQHHQVKQERTKSKMPEKNLGTELEEK